MAALRCTCKSFAASSWLKETLRQATALVEWVPRAEILHSSRKPAGGRSVCRFGFPAAHERQERGLLHDQWKFLFPRYEGAAQISTSASKDLMQMFDLRLHVNCMRSL